MSFISNIRRHLFSRNFNNEFSLIRHYYYLSFNRKAIPPCLVISNLDSRTDSAGFADRLRGMISCYAYSQAINVPFRIEHLEPFALSDYLVPNEYDWELKVGEKSYNLYYANPVSLIQYKRGEYSMRLFRISSHRQHHIFTNINYINDINERYSKNYQFHNLFHELFKPSQALNTLLRIHRSSLNNPKGYVSVSFRFMQLMGDFEDCWGDVLPDSEKAALLDKSISLVRQLFQKENKTIFVTSDSLSFIKEVSRIEHVYVAPGAIGHSGRTKEKSINDKMFIDFFLISEADHVYMARSGKMYRSNFAKTAAMSSNKPFDEIIY